MAIAATTFEHAKALIDRGVEADGTMPAGTAYLLSTSDTARNVRSSSYPLAENLIRGRIFGRTMKQDTVKYATDVLFYFTGVAKVDGLETLRFVPGAIADHLTSSGGNLTDSGQMSALRWLEAGATGSYGAVVEPCNSAAEISVSARRHRPLSAGRNADRGLLEERVDAGAGHLYRRTAGGAVPAATGAVTRVWHGHRRASVIDENKNPAAAGSK